MRRPQLRSAVLPSRIAAVAALGLSPLLLAGPEGSQKEIEKPLRTPRPIPRPAIEALISKAEKAGDFDGAAELAEKVLGRWSLAYEFLLEGRRSIALAEGAAFRKTDVNLAVIDAHLGLFDGVNRWLTQAGLTSYDFHPDREAEAEIVRAMERVPGRRALEAR